MATGVPGAVLEWAQVPVVSALPAEVLVRIGHFLAHDGKDLARAQRVCTAWDAALSEEALWRCALRRTWAVGGPHAKLGYARHSLAAATPLLRAPREAVARLDGPARFVLDRAASSATSVLIVEQSNGCAGSWDATAGRFVGSGPHPLYAPTRLRCKGRRSSLAATVTQDDEVVLERWDGDTPCALPVCQLRRSINTDAVALCDDETRLLVGRQGSCLELDPQRHIAGSWIAMTHEEQDDVALSKVSDITVSSLAWEDHMDCARQVMPSYCHNDVAFVVTSATLVIPWDRRQPRSAPWPAKRSLNEAVCGALARNDTHLAVGLRNGLRVYDTRLPTRYLLAPLRSARVLRFALDQSLVAASASGISRFAVHASLDEPYTHTWHMVGAAVEAGNSLEVLPEGIVCNSWEGGIVTLAAE